MPTVYEIVTEQIVKRIEESGELPWSRPWSGKGGRWAINAKSEKRYRGINAFLLALAPYDCNQWATIKQINELGGRVKKGQRSTPVVFWKKFDGPRVTDDAAEGEEQATNRAGFMLRYYNVFNLEQTEGIDLAAAADYTPNTDHNPIDAAAAIVNGYQNAPAMEMHGGRAYYQPSADRIVMPDLERFKTSEGYYSVLFHEMTHSTGHRARLDRATLNDLSFFGDANYSKEELVAEMGAAYLKREAGILSADELDNSAGYVKGWLSALKSDPKMLVIAAAQAQKAADHILGRNHEEATA